jgi:hypothetical protein
MLANAWFQTGNISTFQHLNLTFGAREIPFSNVNVKRGEP